MAKILFESFNKMEFMSDIDLRKCDRRIFSSSCSFFIISSDAALERC